jgi:hypothetical protein
MKAIPKSTGSVMIWLLACLLGADLALADRRVVPGPDKDPVPGQSKKVTRVDYEDKCKRDQDRKDRAKKCEIHDEDDNDEREAKRRELDVILAEDKAEQKDWARKVADQPEDFTTDFTNIQITPTPKKKSINETKVVEPAVIVKAAQVVVRRAR